MKNRFIRHLLVLFIFSNSVVFSEPKLVERIVAIVNDEIILLSELEEALKPLRNQYQTSYKGEELVNRLAQGKEELLNQLVETKLLLQEARARSIEVSPEETTVMYENVKKSFSSEDEFKNALKEQGLTLSDLSKRLEEQLRIKRLIEQEVKMKINIAVKEVHNYYEVNKHEFFHGAEYKIKHILIKNRPGEENKAEDKAKEALRKIKEGMGFSLVAKEYSEDPNASVNGDLGFVEKDKLFPEIREILEAIKVGEVSDVIETRSGYEIIKLEAIKEAQAKSFDEVKEEIRQKIFQDKLASAYKDWLEMLKKNSYIRIKKEAL